MNRLQKTFQLPKTKTTKPIPKAIDMINILYDEEFVALINNLSGIIKEFYKTKSLLFANMKQLITNSNITAIKSTFDTIEKSYTEFYFDAKTIFKKMKLIRNDNLEKLQSTEVIQSFNQANCRFNTTGPFEVVKSSISKKDISATVLKSKYEQMKSENVLLKKKIDVFQSKVASERSGSQIHSSSKDNTIKITKSNELIDFATTVNKFINIVNKLYPTSSFNDPNLIELTSNLFPVDKHLKNSFNKEKNELTKLCVRYLNNNYNSTTSKTSTSLGISTPSSRKTINMANITSPTVTIVQNNQDSPHDMRGIINKMKQDLEYQTNQVAILFTENEQVKNDFNHLNNALILEINKNKALTEQLLKIESEITTMNKEKVIVNDKYTKLIEENEQLTLNFTNQATQLKNVSTLTKQIFILTEENINLKKEIERLNQLMEAFQLNKKDNDSFEKAKSKKTENQFILLNRKNIDLALKVTAISKEKKIVQQLLSDKEIKIQVLDANIKELSDQIKMNLNEIELLKSNAILEQNKNITLKKENEEINIKMKELIENFNHKMKDRDGKDSIEKINRNLILEFKQKEQELKNLYEIIQIKDNEIKALKDNITNLNNKLSEEINIEKNNNIYQQLCTQEKVAFENDLKASSDEKEAKTAHDLTKLKYEMMTLINNNDLLNKENNELKSKLNDDIRKNEELESIIKGLNDALLNKNDELANIKSSLKSKENYLKEKDSAIKLLKASKESQQNEHEQHMINHINLQTELQKVKDLCQTQLLSINSLTHDKEKLMQESLRLTDSINKENEMKIKIKYLMEENSIIIHDYESKLANQLNEIVQIKQSKEDDQRQNALMINTIQIQLRKLTEDLSLKDEDLITQREINHINEQTLSKQNELISQLNDEINKIKNQLVNKDEHLNEKEECISIFKKEIENMKQMHKSKEDNLSNIISKTQKDIVVLNNNNSQSIDKITKKDEEITRLKSLQNDILAQLSTIQKDIDQREQKHNNSIIEYKKCVHANEEEILKLNSKLSLANEVNENLKQKNTETLMNNQKLLQFRDEEINRLSSLVENKNNIISQNIDLVNSKDHELNNLKENILKKEIEMTASLQYSQMTIEELKKKHDSDITKILDSKTAIIIQLEESLKQKESTFERVDSQLNQNLQEFNQLKDILKQTIQSKDNEIVLLKGSCDINEDKRKEIYNLLKIKEEEIIQQREIIQLKDNEYSNMTQQIKVKENESLKLNNTIKTSIDEINHLHQVITKQEETVKELQLFNKNLNEITIEQKEQLKIKDKEIQSVMITIQNNEQTLNDYKHTIESQDNLIKEFTLSLNESNKKVDYFNTIIINNEKVEKDLQDQIYQSIKDISSLKQSHDEEKQVLIDNISQYSTENKLLNQELSQLREDIKALEAINKESIQVRNELKIQKNNIEKEKEKEIELFTIEKQRLIKLNEEDKLKILSLTNQVQSIEVDKKNLVIQLSIQSDNIQQLTQEAEVSESEITRLNNQIIEDSTDIIDGKNQIGKLHEDKRVLENQLQNNLNLIDDLNKRIDQNTKETIITKDQLKDSLDLINNLNHQRDKQKTEIQNFKEQISALTKQSICDMNQINDLQNQIETFITKTKELINQSNADSGMINNLNNQINTLKQNIEVLHNTSKNEFDDFTKQIKGYIDEIELMKNSAKIDTQTIQKLQNEIETNLNAITSLKSDITAYSLENEQSKKQLESNNNKIEAFKTEIAYYSQEDEKLKKQTILYVNEIKGLKAEIINHSKENHQLKEQIESKVNELNIIQNENKEISKTIKDLNIRHEGNKQQIQELENSKVQRENSLKEKIKEYENHLSEIHNINKGNEEKLISKDKQIDNLNEQIKELIELNKEYKNESISIKELERKIIELNKEIKSSHKSNDDLMDQIKKADIESIKQKEMIKQLTQDSLKYCKDIENDTEVITELKNQIVKEASLNKELNEKIRQLQSEMHASNTKAENYLKEIQSAISLLTCKLSINPDENGKGISLIEIINSLPLESTTDDNNEIKTSLELYTTDNYILLAKVSISTGLTWYLLKSKVSLIGISQTGKDPLDQYKWIISDLIQSQDFNEPTEIFDNNKTQYQEEIQNMQQYQDQLIDQLAKRESDYRKLNLQVAKIINKQKIDDISQEKKLYQTIDQLKEENIKLQHEIQDYKTSLANNKNNGIANRVLGVSFINELNNTSDFMDDSNVEDLLSEITPKGYISNKMLPQQQLKLLFEKLLSEISITVSIRSTIATILKHMQFSNEDINQLFSRFRCGVISLQAGNGKKPNNYGKN